MSWACRVFPEQCSPSSTLHFVVHLGIVEICRLRGLSMGNTAFSPISSLLVGHEARFAPSSRLELDEKRHSVKRTLLDGLH